MKNMLNSTHLIYEHLSNTSDSDNFTQHPCEFFCDYTDEYETPTTASKAAQVFTKPTDVISFVLCVAGLIANGTSIVAVTKLPQKSTHLKLIISLCVSDALILTGMLLHYSIYILTSWYACLRIVVRLTTDLALLSTLINLLVMALDHYAAIIKPLRYKQMMTNFRGCCIILGIWMFCSFAVFVEVLIGFASPNEHRKTFCDIIAQGPYHLEVFIIGFIFVVLLGIMLIYGRIYSRVKKVMVMPRRQRARSHTDSGSVKALLTTVLFVGTFMLFWAPDGIFKVFMYVKSLTDDEYILRNLDEITMAGDILFVILLLNAVADPIIYAIRLPKVKSGFVSMFSSSSKQSVVKRDVTGNHQREMTSTDLKSFARSKMIG